MGGRRVEEGGCGALGGEGWGEELKERGGEGKRREGKRRGKGRGGEEGGGEGGGCRARGGEGRGKEGIEGKGREGEGERKVRRREGDGPRLLCCLGRHFLGPFLISLKGTGVGVSA